VYYTMIFHLHFPSNERLILSERTAGACFVGALDEVFTPNQPESYLFQSFVSELSNGISACLISISSAPTTGFKLPDALDKTLIVLSSSGRRALALHEGL